jgi:hypothetical protein
MTKREGGCVVWRSNDFTHYEVTGVRVDGRRFKIHTKSWMHAEGINLYRGTRWGVLPSGKRVRINTCFNI